VKNKILLNVFMTVVLVMVAGCVPNTVIKSNQPVSYTQTGTPTPNGQIDVPGFNIQLYLPGPNPLVDKTDGSSTVASTLLGIWHGVISPITLVASFINPITQMYEVHNDGSKYNFGFLLGVAIVFLILGALIGSRR
jgi:hypothetical protein